MFIRIFLLSLLSFSLVVYANEQKLEEARSISSKASTLYNDLKFSEALPLFQQALAIFEKYQGNGPDTAGCLSNIANVYHNMRDFNKALEYDKKSLEIVEAVLGSNNPNTAQSLLTVANDYISLNKTVDAIPLFERAVDIFEKSCGSKDINTALSLGELASAYNSIGDYKSAISKYTLALNIWESNLGKGHPDSIPTIINLGFNYQCVGDFEKSLQLYEQALPILQKSAGINSPESARLLSDIGNTYMAMAEPSKALPMFESAIRISEKALGPDDPRTSAILCDLASFYMFVGDFNKAKTLYERGLKNVKKTLGNEDSLAVLFLVNLATVNSSIGDYDNAILLHKQILTIHEKIWGEFHPITARNLSNMANAYEESGDYSNAKNTLEKVLAIYNKLGFENWEYATNKIKLANISEKLGDYNTANSMYESALSIFEKSLGLKHQATSNAFDHLAKINYKKGKLDLAQSYARKFIASNRDQLSGILSLDEKSRLSWQSSNLDFWYASFLEPSLLADICLRGKGAVLESLSEDRAMALAAGSSGEGSSILQKIKSLQSGLSKIAFEEGKESEVSNLQGEIARLQRELTAKYLGRERQRSSASIAMPDIMPALAGGAILVDFIQFRDPKLNGDEALCLGGIITGEDNNPVFVRIDGGSKINLSIDSLRAAINQGNPLEVEAQTKFLSEKLWAPIAAKIPDGTKRIFLCPDANMNFLSFAALLESDGRFVAEKYPITYIGSARDLAKKTSSKVSRFLTIIANPQFDAAAKNTNTKDLVAMRSAEADVFGSIALPPLPGTEAEAASLKSVANESGWQTKSFLGKDATEASVRNTKKPGVLHFATHGFYLNSFTPPGPEGSRGMSVVGVKETAEEKKKKEKGVDPMRASGVAFTGAQQTLTSWSQKKAPDPETDGVLTAEEVGALRLDGTWMVVLSACETGVGEARSGEGVFGLRRAFMIAGAENLLMTLWPVADVTTAKIMTDFYKEAFATGDAPGSLAKVQRDWLVKLRQERGLLAAVREAGPFAMVTMTNPNAQREFVDCQLEGTSFGTTKFSTEAEQLPPVLPASSNSQLSEEQVWLFVDSSDRILSQDELRHLSQDELWRARNEIFARRGYIFKTEKGKSLATSLGDAFKPVSSDLKVIGAQLNPIEKANIEAIQKFEKK